MAGAGQPIEWFLARDNKQYGPVGEAEFAKLIELRHLREQDLVWRAGFADWMPVAAVFPQAFPPPEPMPAAAPMEAPAAALQAPEQLLQPRAPAPSAMAQPLEPVEPRPVAATAGMEPQPTMAAKVEALSEYRARIGARQETVAAPHPQPVEEAPQTQQAAGAGSARASPSRRMWIAPADPEPVPASAPPPHWPEQRHAAQRAQQPHQPAGPAVAPVDAQAAAGFGRQPFHAGAPAAVPTARAAPAGPIAREPIAPRREPAPVRAPAPVRDEPDVDFGDEDDEEPRKRRRWGRKLLGLFAILTLLALIGGGAWMAVMQPQSVRQIMRSLGIGDVKPAPARSSADGGSSTSAKTTAPERKAAVSDMAAAKAAAPVAGAAPLQGFPETAAAIDQMLQAGKLWQLIKTEFPEWYEERLREVQRLVSEKRPDEAVSKHLIDALVALRRKNAEHAFQASLPRLQLVARTFRDNLDALVRHSQVACYSLISSGEGSRGMIGLFRDPQYSPTLQSALVAVFEAIAEGRRAPAAVLPARRGDYDLLTRELTALGWAETDLALFADSQQLARSSPEQVCRMVREWFTAHLAVPDSAVQARLLVESIKPVVAG